MALLDGPPEHLSLRNVALMLFSEHPDKFFPYTYIDLVHFPKGPADKQFIEKQFKGPVQQQVRQALDYIQGNLLHQLITKVDGQAETVRVWNYPYKALEELLANCIYHRNYQEREPVTIRIEPDAIYIYNLGGPDRSIRLEDFQKGQVFPKRYRNRRLGDFLKELELTEGRATGIPVILEALRHNGSPNPVFETDPERTWFQVKLPLHPAFAQINADLKLSNISNGAQLAGLIGSLVDDQASDQVDDQVLGMMGKLLLWVQTEPRKRSELLKHLGLSNHNDNVKKYLEPLEAAGLLAKTLPDKPQSPKQKYSLTEKGRVLLSSLTWQ